MDRDIYITEFDLKRLMELIQSGSHLRARMVITFSGYRKS